MVEECRERGWRAFFEPIEVGCRDFKGRSLYKVFSRLGITGAAASIAASEVTGNVTRWLC